MVQHRTHHSYTVQLGDLGQYIGSYNTMRWNKIELNTGLLWTSERLANYVGI